MFFPVKRAFAFLHVYGVCARRMGIRKNGVPLPDSVRSRTLGTLLETAGYATAYAGKWHAHTNSLPDKHAFGFENLHGHNDYGLAEAAVEFLKRKHEKPFFLVASFDNPHNICEYARNQKLPYATIEEPDLDECPNLPANHSVAPYDADVLAYEKRQSYRLYPTQNFTHDDWRRYRNAYFRLVETVDSEIGKIVDEIDRQNLWKNTIIIFSSDHGDGAGAHQWNQKTVLYEEVVNVPLIVCLPGGKHAGKVLPQLVNNGTDLLPSICDWADVQVPAGCRGVSYRTVAEQGNPQKSISLMWLLKHNLCRPQEHKVGRFVLHDTNMYCMNWGRTVKCYMIWRMTGEKCVIWP